MKIIKGLLILFFGIQSFNCGSQVFLNPSLTGAEAPSTAAPSWDVISPSPDLVTIPTGFGITYTALAPTVSPDGGTFQLIYQNAIGSYTEEFGQTVSGFTIGALYTINFYEANFGPCSGGVCYAGTAETVVKVSGVGDFTSGNLLPVSNDWLEGCISFTATSETHTISFRTNYLSGDPDGAWTAIDYPVISVGGGGGDIVDFYYENSELCFDDEPQFPIVDGDASGSFSSSPGGLDIDSETGEIDPNDSDVGEYDVYYILPGCPGSIFTTTVTIIGGIVANFESTTVCLGNETEFTNTSFYSGDLTLEWEWDFGDGSTSTDSDPNHEYAEAGIYEVTLLGSFEGNCPDSIIFEVEVYPAPIVIAAASDTEICEGEEVILTGTGADDYTWDLGVIDGEAFIPAELGTITYTVVGVNDLGCEGSASIDITIYPIPIVTASASPVELCLGESTVLTGGGADTYSWDGGITDGIAFTPTETGEFEFTVIGTDSETTCSNTASITFSVFALPEVGATASATEVCFGESLILNGTGADVYSWSDGITDGLSFTPATIGLFTYTVVGINEFGCEGTASIVINVIDCEPVIAGFEMANMVCVNQCITLSDTSVGDINEWLWDFGAATDPNTSDRQNPIICLNTIGIFTITLTVTSEAGATSTTNQDIIVHPTPLITASLDTIIDMSGTAELICTTSSAGDFSWTPAYDVDCPNCPVTTASPSGNETYIITLIDNNGCKSSDSVLVYVNYELSVGVPTAFSPNGDGNNDVLFVKGASLLAIHFVIYNRYGEQIFETTDQNIGWDGSFMNKDENPGVFTWVLNYTTQDSKSGRLKGNTTLIR